MITVREEDAVDIKNRLLAMRPVPSDPAVFLPAEALESEVRRFAIVRGSAQEAALSRAIKAGMLDGQRDIDRLLAGEVQPSIDPAPATAVGRLRGRQVEGERPALCVGDGVELSVAAASANANRLGVSPPFPPAAERWTFTCVLAIRTSAGGPPSAASASNTVRHTPFSDQRL